MKKFLCFLLLLSGFAAAEQISIDPSSRSFEMRKLNKRVDVFDFSGEFPNLENIDIDAKRRKRVEFYLTGDFPLLETLTYEGCFGFLKSELTGNFPLLREINFLCTSCAMTFDLTADWQRSCDITIRGMDEDVILKLPKDVGLIIHTKTAPNGKVILGSEELKKKGWFRIWKKTYRNPLVATSDVVLTINVETKKGCIILN